MISLNGSSVARRGRCCMRQFLRLQQHGTPICDSSLAAVSKKYRTVSNVTFSPIEETMTESRMSRFASSFKRRVAAAAMCEEAGAAELAQHFSVYSSQVSSWKRQGWRELLRCISRRTLDPQAGPNPESFIQALVCCELLQVQPSSFVCCSQVAVAQCVARTDSKLGIEHLFLAATPRELEIHGFAGWSRLRCTVSPHVLQHSRPQASSRIAAGS